MTLVPLRALLCEAEFAMRPTIHVVDDDAPTRRALTRLIEALGFTVESFESGEAFIASSASDSAACLLVDIHMPGMNGVELCLKLASSGRAIPVILMSAHRDPHTRMLAGQANPIATLYKPFDEVELLDAISRAIAHSP